MVVDYSDEKSFKDPLVAVGVRRREVLAAGVAFPRAVSAASTANARLPCMVSLQVDVNGLVKILEVGNQTSAPTMAVASMGLKLFPAEIGA